MRSIARVILAGLVSGGCIQVAGVDDVEPLPDAGGLPDGATAPREVDYLKPRVPGASDRFGSTVATAPGFAAVGAASEDSSAVGINGTPDDDSLESAGAAYVFESAASEPTYVKPAHASAALFFGSSVAASGDTLVIGAPGDDSSLAGVNVDPTDTGAEQSGAVFVFVRDGSSWVQQAYIKAGVPQAFNHFGRTVAIDGDTLVVGSPDDDDVARQSGGAYVFVRSAGGVWSQQAHLKAPVPADGAMFGSSVAIDGDLIVVGTPWAKADTAHVFARQGTAWSHRNALAASTLSETTTGFGMAVAIRDGVIAVSAPFADVRSDGEIVELAGAVHLFDTDGQQLATLSPEPRAQGQFGRALALDAGRLVASRSLTEDVAVFEQRGADWEHVARLQSLYSEGGDQFGSSLGLAGDRLIVGAPRESSGVVDRPTDNTAPEAGAAYLFEL